jgi:predicted aspartyl protease
LFVTDQKTRQSFLIDTGSDISCVPRSCVKTLIEAGKPNYELKAANGSKIKTYGTKRLNLLLGLRRDFIYPFVVADVKFPIIGSDFLTKFNLMVNLKERKLMELQTCSYMEIEQTKRS